MDVRIVECLSCGETRHVGPSRNHLQVGECPRCSYVGWAVTGELSELTRRALRDRPLERRRLRRAS